MGAMTIGQLTPTSPSRRLRMAIGAHPVVSRGSVRTRDIIEVTVGDRYLRTRARYPAHDEDVLAALVP